MSVHDVRPSSSASIPRPRTPDAAAVVPQEGVAAPRPWEPWRLPDGVRPSTQYWDVGTASWRSRGPEPRRGD